MTKFINPNPYIRLRILDSKQNSIVSTSDFKEIEKIEGVFEEFYVGREFKYNEKKLKVKNIDFVLLKYSDINEYGISLDNDIGQNIPYLAQINVIVE